MATWESNGHVTDDDTWPRKVKVVTPICLGPSISKTAGDRDLVPMDTNRKLPHSRFEWSRDWWRLVTRKGQGHHLQYIWGRPLSWQRLEIRTWCQWSTYRKWLPGNQMVTWTMTSCDHEWSRSWHSVILKVKIVLRIWYQFVSTAT